MNFIVEPFLVRYLRKYKYVLGTNNPAGIHGKRLTYI